MFWQKKSIEEKAKKLAPSVVELSRTVAPTLHEALYSLGQAKPDPQRESDQRISLAMELIYLSFHLLDRECFARHGPNERARFIDTLFLELWTPLLDALPAEAAIISKRVMREQTNQAQLEYAEFVQLLSRKGEPLGGTLIWEFSKKMCMRYNPSSDEAAIYPVSVVAAEYVLSLYGLIDTVKL
jgi:hypothetical protein